MPSRRKTSCKTKSQTSQLEKLTEQDTRLSEGGRRVPGVTLAHWIRPTGSPIHRSSHTMLCPMWTCHLHRPVSPSTELELYCDLFLRFRTHLPLFIFCCGCKKTLPFLLVGEESLPMFIARSHVLCLRLYATSLGASLVADMSGIVTLQCYPIFVNQRRRPQRGSSFLDVSKKYAGLLFLLITRSAPLAPM